MGRQRRKCHRHAGERIVETDLGVVIAKDRVIAAAAFETIERIAKTIGSGAARIRKRSGGRRRKSRSIENVGKIGPTDGLDREQRIVTGGRPGHRASSELNVDGRAFVAIEREVKTVTPVY